MRRLLTFAAIPVAAAIGSTALVVGVSGTAWAGKVSPTPGSSVACTSIKYNATTGAATVSKCYTAGEVATPKAFKELVAENAADLLGGNSPIPWSPGPSGGASITTSSLSSTSPGMGTCAGKGNESTTFSGTVTAAPGTGNPGQVGDVVSISICVNPKSGKITLAKGTAAEF